MNTLSLPRQPRREAMSPGPVPGLRREAQRGFWSGCRRPPHPIVSDGFLIHPDFLRFFRLDSLTRTIARACSAVSTRLDFLPPDAPHL